MLLNTGIPSGIPEGGSSIPEAASPAPGTTGSASEAASSTPGGTGSTPGETSSAPGETGSAPGEASSAPETAASVQATASPSPQPQELSPLSAGLLGAAAGIGAAILVGALAALLVRKLKKHKIPPKGQVQFEEPPLPQLGIEKLHEQGRRSSQQDCFSVSPEEMAPTHGRLILVADGMGGLSDGDKISQAAVSAAISAFPHVQGQPDEVLVELLYRSNEAVNRLLGPSGFCQGGSTMLMGLLREGVFYWLSVGDSRIVLYRDGALYQLNRDHVYTNELYVRAANGEITPREASSHQNGGGLTSFLGMGTLKYVDIPTGGIRVRPGDRFVLMSDGVYNALTEEELCAGIAAGAEALGQAVAGKGYRDQDNYTAVILRC